MDLGLSFYLTALILVFLIGVSKSGLALGFGALGVPALSFFVPPPFAAGILLPVMLSVDGANLWNYRKHFMLSHLKVMLPGALLGILLGSLAFGTVNPAFILILVGLIALWFSTLHFARHQLPAMNTKLPIWAGFLMSAISGFTSHLAHAGGPPVRSYLLNQNLHKTSFMGTFGYFFALVNVLKAIPYVMFGQITFATLKISAILVLVVPLGVWAGMALHKRIPQEQFRTLAYVFLTFAGIKLLTDGVSQIL